MGGRRAWRFTARRARWCVPIPTASAALSSYTVREDGTRRELPLLFPYAENSRALGLADMAKALRTGRAFRADCQQTFHVLEIMESLYKSSQEQRFVPLTSAYTRREPMRIGLLDGILDD